MNDEARGDETTIRRACLCVSQSTRFGFGSFHSFCVQIKMFPINTRANQISFFAPPFALERIPASFGAFFCGRGRDDEGKKRKSAKIKDILGLGHVQASDEARAPVFFFASYQPDLTDTPAYAVQQSTATMVFPSRKLLYAHNKPLTQLCTIRPSRRVCGSRRWARTRIVLGHVGRTDDERAESERIAFTWGLFRDEWVRWMDG